ncbi:hypothetical protein J4230_00805 [Candidatus Woesearchaeota archaeon]|nr:hypothetical protein [Candidatus Woesearchaeota archaeon]
MIDYFQESQMVKAKIVLQSEIIYNANEALSGRLEEFSFGGTVNLYRIGKLESGLYIALRKFRPEMPEGISNLDNKVKKMEAYCQNAGKLRSKNEGVPNFCVGIVNEIDVGILTEDLIANGGFEFDHNPDNEFGFVIQGNNRRKVWVDIDHLFGDRKYNRNPEIKYFTEGARINL